MKIYISLPISHHDEATQRRKANHWKHKFEQNGHEVINPFDIGDKLEQIHKDCRKPKPTWQDYMDADIPELETCDTIFLIDGWHNSKGCLQEVSKAIELKIKFVLESELV